MIKLSVLLNTNLKNTKSLRIEDAKSAFSLKKQKSPNYRYMMHRLAGFSDEEYNDMEYDLSEIARIIDTEALVAACFRKKRQLILKNGYTLESENERNLKYIKKRLGEMEYVTSQSFDDLISEIAENLVNFNNCFLLKYRKEESSSGEIRESDTGAEIKPIAGLFALASPTVDTATNAKTGQIIRYRHRITDNYSKQFRPNDIFHIAENRRVGITIGTPSIEAVKDDIIMLRSIEQDTESMIHRHANPFMLVKVGTDNSPARILGDGVSEIDVYSALIDNIDEEGGAAVPHRVDVQYLGAESQALRLESYLSYFKQRVLTGLCVSEVDLGSATGGASTEIASNAMKEDVRSYQKTIEKYVTNYIFNELLLEAPFYRNVKWIPQEERVVLTFLEPDLDKRIKIESHYLLLYQSGLISKEAAIRKMEFNEEDLNTEIMLAGNAHNSVKSTISNNIIEPKNQHNLPVADSLNISHYDSITNFYRQDIAEFIKILKDYFPEDLVDNNITLVNTMHKRLDSLLADFGLESVNKYIESTLFSILLKNT